MKKTAIYMALVLTIACGKKVDYDVRTQMTGAASPTKIETYSQGMDLGTDNEFTHVATFQPATYNGLLLQATAFEKGSNLIYVSYNSPTNEIRGGLDIISLSSTNVPSLVKSLTSDITQYVDLKLSGNHLFMVGQKKNATRNYAVLTVLNVSDPSNPIVVSEMIFNGYYATSIDIQNGKAYITVPNLGVKIINITTPTTLVDLGTTIIGSSNALFVRRHGTSSVVLGGAVTHGLSVVSTVQNTQFGLNAGTQAPPTRFTYKGEYLYTNGGTSGLSIIRNFATTTPAISYQGTLSGTGNGLALGTCNKLYLAQAEQGLQVFNITNKTAPVNEGTFSFTNATGRANNTFFFNSNNENFVLVADSVAGVQMVKVVINNCANQNDTYVTDSENHGSGLLCKAYDLSTTTPNMIPDFSTMTPIGYFRTNIFNVISQSSNNAFPLFPASLANYKTWYGLSCEGVLSSTYVGSSAISLGSDDGSRLYLDNVLVVNNDGTHSPATVTSNYVMQARDYKVKIDYYQGPASQIQLELKIKSGTMTQPAYLTNFFN